MEFTLDSTPKLSDQASTVVFVDVGVENYQQLVNGVIPTAEVFTLDVTADGIEQISKVLQQRQHVGAVHIISHGAPGQIFLGRSPITLDKLTESNVGQWQQYLSADAEILLYGCNVAAQAQGRQFVERLAQLTGAKVYASNAVVGSSERGGSWKLASFAGTIDLEALRSAFAPKVLARYQGAFPQTINPGGGGSGSDDLEVTIYENGTFQILRDGETQVFGNPPSTTFGIALGVGSTTYVSKRFDDLKGNPSLEFINQSDVSGAGTSADPFQVTTTFYADLNNNATYNAATDIQVEWITTYVAPNDFFSNRFNITTPVDNASEIKLYQHFDTRLKGNDQGPAYGLTASNTELTGTSDNPQFIGVRQNAGTTDEVVMGFIENQVEFSRWFSGEYSIADEQVNNGGDLTNTYDTTSTTDNGLAIQYDLGLLTGTTAISNILAFSTEAVQTVIDNEAPTDITLSSTSINENVAANSLVGIFSTTDANTSDSFTYTLVTGEGATHNSAFTIDGNELRIQTSPDFETQSSYSIRVQTDDGSGGTYEEAFTINVEDQDESGQNQAPTDITLSSTSINENVAANSLVGRLSTTDANTSDSFTYTLVTGEGATHNSAFTIKGNELRIQTSPDFETQSSYNIRVRTTDSGGLSHEQPLTIGVNDLDESGQNPAPPKTSNWAFLTRDYNLDQATDVVAIKKSGTGSGSTEVHIMDRATNYQSWLLQTGTVLHETDDTWDFLKGDHNRDGATDILSIKKSGTGSGRTEVHIMDAANNYQSWLIQTPTALHETGDDWDFVTGDYNGDGVTDIFGIKQSGTGSGRTEIHVLDGASNYQNWLLQTGTALHETGDDWDFLVGDYNSDGATDIFGIKQSETGSAKTEIHVLDGASNYQNWLMQTPTALHETDDSWGFLLDDYTLNNPTGIISLKERETGSGTTEAHILNGGTTYQNWLLQTGSVLPEIVDSSLG
jgi:hypothetical protein